MSLDPLEIDQDGRKRQSESLIERDGGNNVGQSGVGYANDDKGSGLATNEHGRLESSNQPTGHQPSITSNLVLAKENISEATPISSISQSMESQHNKPNNDPGQSIKPKVLGNDEIQASLSTSASLSSPGLYSANAVKKFNSLSVAKQFLQKASPTLGNATAAPLLSVKGSSGSSANPSISGSSKLSSMMPASRLTSAKLTTSSKPAGAGWAQVPSATTAAQINDPNPPPASAAIESGTGNGATSQSNVNSTYIENSGVTASTPSPATSIPAASSASGLPSATNVSVSSTTAVPSPRLVTALSTRSTSPHVRSTEGSKGSPGLRNAAISGLGRTSSPSTNNTTSTSVRAPWAAVKKEAPPASTTTRGGLGKRTEFPTAAEAAQAKIEAEKKEKAAAAEAALKAEQALQNLEKFRGTSLGTHWDEMDDDDFGDGELRFGDGSSYKVFAQPPEKEVSKEERFQDVGHDRSWPPQSGTQAQQPQQRKQTRTEHTERVKPHKVETVAVRSGEGISLDAPSSMVRPHSFYSAGQQQKERRSSFLGRQKEPREDHGHHSGHGQSNAASSFSAQAASVPSQIRAWGPLAQRQASLNPDAPKPAPVVNAVSATAPTTQSSNSTTEKIDIGVIDSKGSEPISKPTTHTSQSSTADQSRSRKSTMHTAQSQSATAGRALPPHLALRQALPAQDSTQRQVDIGTVERPDWRTAVPRPLEEEKPTQPAQKEIIARPYGSLVASARQNQSRPPHQTQALENQESSRPSRSIIDSGDDRTSALERARKRKEVEEEERKRERERALAKAAAIEAKMREAQEVEDRKKRLAEEEVQRVKEEEQRRKAEKERTEEQRRIDSRNRSGGRQNQNVPDRIENKNLPRGPKRRTSQTDHEPPSGLQISTASDRTVSSLLSPSDEAVSWRRGPKLALHSAAPGSSEGSSERGKQEIQPQKILLRRPESSNADERKGALSPVTDQNHAGQSSKKGFESPILDSTSSQKRQGRNSTRNERGSDFTKDAIPTKNENEDPKRRSDRSRVEIIAPTDEGAAKHLRVAQQREREARQSRDGSAKVPVGVLKSSNQKEVEASRQVVRPTPVKPESEQTRSEVPFDGAPVWNKFQVRIGRRLNKPFVRLSKDELRAQQSRIAKAKDISGQHISKPVSILSWTPPILDLPARTLSRDDQFFPKKYRKGVRIANVILPSLTMAQLTDQNSKERQQKKTQRDSEEKLVDSQTYVGTALEANNTSNKPSVRVPSASNKQRTTNELAFDLSNNSLMTDEKSHTTPRPQHRNRDVNGAVAFARSNIARESDTPSPVSFTMQSELDNASAAPAVLLGNKNLSANRTPKSTWGESSLTFAGLDTSRNVEGGSKEISQSGTIDAEVERNRIKDAWVSLPSDATNETGKPAQNSLRDIVDLEIPSAISMSMHDLRADDVQSHHSESLRQSDDHDSTLKSAKSLDTHLYTSLEKDGNDDPSSTNNARKGFSEFAMMTAASSPVNVASPTHSGHLFGGGVDTVDRRANLHHQIGRARSQSPSSMRYAASISMGKSMASPGSPSALLLTPNNGALPNSSTGNHRGAFLQQERGGARAAFGPYAYPNTTGTYSSDMQSTLSQQHSQPQSQQYAAYGMVGQNAMASSQVDGYDTGYGSSAYDNSSLAFNNRNYRGGNGSSMGSGMMSNLQSAQHRSQNYDAFGNAVSIPDSAYSTLNDRNAYSNSNLLSGSGGRRDGGYLRNSANSAAFGGEMMGNMMGSETVSSTAGWPIDSSTGSYLGNTYNAQHANTYFAGYQSVNPAVNSSGYGSLQQQPSTLQGMHSMSSPSTYNRSSSQHHNRFGSSNYRGGMNVNNATLSNGHESNNNTGQWGNRNTRSHGMNPSPSMGTTGLHHQQYRHQHGSGGGNAFNSTSFPRTVAGSTLQATAKPFQLNSDTEGSRTSSQHQSYPRNTSDVGGGGKEGGSHANAYGMDRTSFSYDGGQQQTDSSAGRGGGNGGGNYDTNPQW